MSAITTADEFLAQLEELPKLKAFPAAASRLLAECDDPKLTPVRIAEIVRCDPAIAGRLLQVSNSPLYGYCGKIRTIEQAVVVLGMKAIHNLTMAMAGELVFAEGQVAMDQRRALWRHSLAVATVGRLFAPYCEATPDEAFLAGVFHDVGKLVIYDLAPETYLQLDESLPAAQRIEQETQTFGIDHAELGMDCSDDWGLPNEIGEAIGSHHRVDEAEPGLPKCTAVANALAHRWQLSLMTSPREEEVDPQATLEVLEKAGLEMPAEEAVEFQQSAEQHYADIMQSLS